MFFFSFENEKKSGKINFEQFFLHRLHTNKLTKIYTYKKGEKKEKKNSFFLFSLINLFLFIF